MKINKTVLLSMILILLVVITFGCRDFNSSVQENNIEKFINEKSALYDKKDEIIDAFNSLDRISSEENIKKTLDVESEENLNDILKDVRVLITKKEYESLLSNRKIIENSLLEDTFDRSEIKNIEHEKTSEDNEKSVYKVRYTENLYFKNKLQEEKDITSEFTLKKIAGEWLISNIN